MPSTAKTRIECNNSVFSNNSTENRKENHIPLVVVELSGISGESHSYWP